MDEYRRYGRRQLPVSDRGSPPAERLPVHLRPLWSYRAPAIAASLVMLLSLGVWQAAKPKPEANVLIVDLFAEGSTRSSESDEGVVNFSGGASSCLLLVHGPGPDLSEPSYRAVIRTAKGRELFQSGDLRQSPFGTFSLSFPEDFFDPGDYVLTLHGGSPEPLGEYAFSVRQP